MQGFQPFLLSGHARHLAKKMMAKELPQRWAHVKGVVTKAKKSGQVLFDPADRDLLIAAAWLHDIGYAPEIVDTGFHALDGARWLQKKGFDSRVVNLVAHHTFSVFEAEERGLKKELSAFYQEEGLVRDLLTYADISTSPQGKPIDPRARIEEVKERYGPDHLVTRSITKAAPHILRSVRMVYLANSQWYP